MPATQAVATEVKRANSAAASAGTTCNGSVLLSNWTIGAASTPSSPATTLAISVLASDSRLVDSPISRPARGVIDLVLFDRLDHVVVATEAQSQIRRLEAQGPR